MHKIFTEISEIGIVPVIAIGDAEKAVPLARALLAGGIPCAEVTFRTPQAEEAIRRIAREAPGILLGAGTVTTTEQVERAVAAGAKFIVSPGFSPKVVAHCVKQGIPIAPGCASPSDIEAALEYGLEVVKFFPAEQAGGLAYIKAIAAPYGNVKFIPTGGINAANIEKYLGFERVVACGGSWMVPPELVNAGAFGEVTRLCREAVRTVLGFALAHIGIHAANEAEAMGVAELFAAAFGFEVAYGNSSFFAGGAVEVVKSPCPGKNGHMAICTNSVARAKRYLASVGFGFDEATAKTDDKGRQTSIYLKKDFGGFAMHLLQKK